MRWMPQHSQVNGCKLFCLTRGVWNQDAHNRWFECTNGVKKTVHPPTGAPATQRFRPRHVMGKARKSLGSPDATAHSVKPHHLPIQFVFMTPHPEGPPRPPPRPPRPPRPPPPPHDSENPSPSPSPSCVNKSALVTGTVHASSISRDVSQA